MCVSSTRRQIIRAAGSAAFLAVAKNGAAQSKFPQLKIVCGLAAGGEVDQLSRHVAGKLQPGYANSVIVENKPGAYGQLALSYVKSQPGDGGTILASPMVQLSLFPFTFKSLPYNPLTDFTILTAGVRVPFALAVGPMVPSSVRSLKDYLGWVKQDPKYGSVAVGGVTAQIITSVLSKASGSDLVPVPYKGGTPATMDTIGGTIPAVATGLGELLPRLADGRLRLIALASEKRHPLIPDVPTLGEQGIADLDINLYYSFFVRAGTPHEIVEAHSVSLRAALENKEVVAALARLAMEVVPTGPKDSAEILARDREKWKTLVKRIEFIPS